MTNRGEKEVHKNIQLRFVDSCGFMASSLDKNLREFYEGDKVFKLMRHKGVYPFEYMHICEIFEEVKLSLRNAFDSKLNIKVISDQYYEYAQQVWNRMLSSRRCFTIGRRI